MFTDENTSGYSKLCLQLMNAELVDAIKEIEPYTDAYYEEEKRASEEILKKWDNQLCEVVDFFFKEV
jgi:hypothetical protein